MWRIRATWRWDGGKPCAARPSSTSSASANGSSNPAFRTHVRNAEDGPRACRHAGCCEGSSNAKSCGTTRRPADTVFLHVYARSLDVIPVSDPLSDPPESHGRMAHAATCDTWTHAVLQIRCRSAHHRLRQRKMAPQIVTEGHKPQRIRIGTRKCVISRPCLSHGRRYTFRQSTLSPGVTGSDTQSSRDRTRQALPTQAWRLCFGVSSPRNGTKVFGFGVPTLHTYHCRPRSGSTTRSASQRRLRCPYACRRESRAHSPRRGEQQ